ncbi:MAG: protoporphyrinogen oxidase [Candidatus Zixiibacteriota bacterium]
MSASDVVIIGGGISGLSALHFLRRNQPQLDVRLFEADSRLGGTIGTDHIDGYSFDWGPNGFLDREPLTLQLCDELGLTGQLERANESVNNRYILKGGRLRSVPMSPPKFLMADIISWPGKLRVAMEPFAKSRAKGIDESIYDFARRRIGREAADYLVQPMVSGVYGGVAQKMSLQSCFPVMREMEDEYGSLFKAMIAKAKAAKAKDKKSGSPSGPGGWLTSFRGGLDRIIARFHQEYEPLITMKKNATTITKEGGVFTIRFGDGSTETAMSVVIAAPSYEAAKVTGGLSRELAAALAKIPYAPIAVVCAGYRAEQVKSSVDGFGFLVPQKENRKILGSIWTSSIFAERAPDGMIQFRTMLGGDGFHESIEMTDEQLLEAVKSDLCQIMKVEGEPQIARMFRWKNGIPQYRVGHRKLLDTIEREISGISGLYLAGNAYYGIGLNDCVKQSHRAAQSISSQFKN